MVAPNEQKVVLTRSKALEALRVRISGMRSFCNLLEAMAAESHSMSDADVAKLINSTRYPFQGIRKAVDCLPMDDAMREAYEALKKLIDIVKPLGQ